MDYIIYWHHTDDLFSPYISSVLIKQIINFTQTDDVIRKRATPFAS